MQLLQKDIARVANALRPEDTVALARQLTQLSVLSENAWRPLAAVALSQLDAMTDGELVALARSAGVYADRQLRSLMLAESVVRASPPGVTWLPTWQALHSF